MNGYWPKGAERGTMRLGGSCTTVSPGRLMAVCMRYAGDRATAEDLLHDAFLKIYGAFGRFSYRGPGIAQGLDGACHGQCGA